jgi:Fe-S-cluster containining protein
MAKHLGMEKKDFLRQYTEASSKIKTDRWYKTVGEDRKCPFLGEGGCKQYEGRGQVCRHYPFYSVPCVTTLRNHKPMALFPKCHGMINSFIEILTFALTMDPKDRDKILANQLVPRLCFLHMMLAVGTQDVVVDRLIKEMGLANMPPEAALKQDAWMYAAAVIALWGERKIQNALMGLREIVTTSA